MKPVHPRFSATRFHAGSFSLRLGVTMLLSALSLQLLSGCEGPPPNATGANPPAAATESATVRSGTSESSGL